ncbi:MAG: rod shape-determining protein MreC [Candidatus Symbiothrix sp.]|jgi:rod shape-determining protein MreC|nr:rod shape-determining protein MreC [Candidatus Symbiothrix sp.]
MRNLINFIFKNVHWLLFFLLVSLSVLLIVNNNRFQRSKYLAVSLEVTGRLYAVSAFVESYMNLRETNTNLMKKIAELENTIQAHEHQIELLSDTGSLRKIEPDSSHFTLKQAKVVNNSVTGIENYILLNKGSEDGIERDMGVISHQGIVGVIMGVSRNFSLVIPVLNPKFRPSGRVKSNNYFGPLIWDGKDPRYTYLQELPRHIHFEINDTVVTSGFSGIFPGGLPVGKIVDSMKQKNDNYTSLKIELFANFHTLTDVLIIKNSYREEQQILQKK